MNFIGKTFGKGLIVVLPIAGTIFLLLWVGSTIDNLLNPLIEHIPNIKPFPGLGLIVAVIAVFVIGILMRVSIMTRLKKWAESMVQRIPLVNSLYSSLRDLMGMFGGEKKGLSKVALIDLGDGRGQLLGFITRENFDDMPDGVGDENHVAVYLPMSYQLGGYTTIVHRDAITLVDMSMDEAMRFALTAGVKAEDNDN